MTDLVKNRLRQTEVEAKLDALAHYVNREATPTINEIRQRLNEYIQALNTANVVVTAGSQTAYLEVTVGGQPYSIPLHSRA